MKYNPHRIYIADDNPQYLELLKVQLEAPNREIKSFSHYEPLIEALSDRPDIVVLDHLYGDQAEGLNLLAQIKTIDPTIHVILISSQQDVEVALSALKNGATDYLEKDGSELVALEASVAQIIEDETLNREPGMLIKLGQQIWKLGRWRNAALLVFILLMLSGCVSQKSTQGNQMSKVPKALAMHRPHTLRPDDKISLSIWNNDDISVGSVFGIYNSNEVYGKWILVDAEGNVTLPMIGDVHLQGQSVTEAAKTLKEEYGKEIRDPVIVVRVLNREVTVTGEVNQPGNYILDKEKNTLAEVLGMAEGMTDYAKLKEVTLTRNVYGRSKVYPLDLRKMTGYELKQILVRDGDVIHIPGRAGKRVERKLPLLIPLASLVTSVGVLFSVTKKRD